MTQADTLFDVEAFVVDPGKQIGIELGLARAEQRLFIAHELGDVPPEDWGDRVIWEDELPVVLCIAAVGLAEAEIRLRGGTVPTDFDDHHETLIGRLNQEGPDSPFVLDVDAPPFNNITGYCRELVDAVWERAVAIGHASCEEVMKSGVTSW